jgi:hypothetical protein
MYNGTINERKTMKLFADVIDQDVLDTLPESTLDELLDIFEKAGY